SAGAGVAGVRGDVRRVAGAGACALRRRLRAGGVFGEWAEVRDGNREVRRSVRGSDGGGLGGFEETQKVGFSAIAFGGSAIQIHSNKLWAVLRGLGENFANEISLEVVAYPEEVRDADGVVHGLSAGVAGGAGAGTGPCGSGGAGAAAGFGGNRSARAVALVRAANESVRAADAACAPKGVAAATTRGVPFAKPKPMPPVAKMEPIPTQWPNAKFEPIPTQWLHLQVMQLGAQPAAGAVAVLPGCK